MAYRQDAYHTVHTRKDYLHTYIQSKRSSGCFSIYLCWVGKYINIIMKPTQLPNPRPTQPQKNQVKSGILGHFFPQQIFFRGLGLVLYRKQTTRNPTQPNSPQTPITYQVSDKGCLIYTWYQARITLWYHKIHIL